jgi:hypothetical protein
MKWNENSIINGFKLISKSSKKGYWLAEHKCGRIFEYRNTQIKNQKYCKGCISEYFEINKGSNHKSWKGFGDLSSDLFTTIKLNARDRGLEFSIDIEYLWNLFLNQNKKCALTDITIHLNDKCDDRKYKTATLDRIDSRLGYIKDNVQWVHRDINKMKSNLPEDYFFKLCELVYKKRTSNFEIKDGAFYKNGNFLNKNYDT